jgi:hypothetical protein
VGGIVAVSAAASGGNPDVAAENAQTLGQVVLGAPTDAQPSDASQPTTQGNTSSNVQKNPTAQSEGTNQYTTGINYCASVSHAPNGDSIFHNVCSTRINVWWASTTGHGSLTLGPGDQGTGAGTNMSGGAKGVYEYYVCSEHFLAVDSNDRPIVSMVADFKCMNRGY